MLEANFTYNWFSEFIHNLKIHGYKFCDYNNWQAYERCVILRHDIDNNIDKAVRIAEIESRNDISSTFFVLLTSDFYNVFSFDNMNRIHRIISLGHDIGLHFDEVRYPEAETSSDIVRKMEEEAGILSLMIGRQVTTVSMHRPSEKMIKEDIKIPNLINSYGHVFFNEFKYLSDSRRRWKESVDRIICDEEYDRLHILTHPFWYNDVETSIHDTVSDFVNEGSRDRYRCMNKNFRRLDEIMSRDEVL